MSFESIQTVTFSSSPYLRVRHWNGEKTSVVFNLDSGNTFEIDELSQKLISISTNENVSLSEAMKLTGNYEGKDPDDMSLTIFLKTYLLPLHQLDLIQIIPYAED